ncbi:MAG: hypothetical protein K0Q60_4133 [Microvirga sp.]|jgi:hypothetical protein|nr:hypothetical protein [Microvirga sp.]
MRATLIDALAEAGVDRFIPAHAACGGHVAEPLRVPSCRFIPAHAGDTP